MNQAQLADLISDPEVVRNILNGYKDKYKIEISQRVSGPLEDSPVIRLHVGMTDHFFPDAIKIKQFYVGLIIHRRSDKIK